MTKGESESSGAALVLGGSGGIGAACASRLARNHDALAISYRHNEEAAKHLLAEVGHGSCHALDISSAQQCAAVVDEVIQQHGRISSMVYAVGSNIGQPLANAMA